MASWRATKVVELDQPADRVFDYLCHWECYDLAAALDAITGLNDLPPVLQ